MDLWYFLILALLGIIGGLLSGLIGVGGGVFFVPALVYAVDWGIKEAVAASLAVIIFSSLSGTIRNARSRDPVDWRVAGLLSAAVAPASLIGAYISRVSPDTVVKLSFAVIMLLLALPTARGRPEFDENSKRYRLSWYSVRESLSGRFRGSSGSAVG